MTDQELFGRLVYLTTHADAFLRESNPGFAASSIVLANRIARVTKVFDWESKEGKYLLKEREKTGKWKAIDSKAYKFVVSICYPELVKGEKVGIVVDEVMPRFHPTTKQALFEVLPEWVREELSKEKSVDRTFNLVPKKKG